MIVLLFLILLQSTFASDNRSTDPQNVTYELGSTISATYRDLYRHFREVQIQSYNMREESVRIREEAHDLRVEAYSAILEALKLKEEMFTKKTQTEKEMLIAVQAIVSTSLKLINKIPEFETKMKTMGEIMLESARKINILDSKVEDVSMDVISLKEGSLIWSKSMDTVKRRLEVMLSEVRLISQHKITGQTGTHTFCDSGLAVDGLFHLDNANGKTTRSYTHTLTADRDNKLWIELGGLFKIKKVKIWNLMHCCRERLVGTKVYADDTLIGVVLESKSEHDFLVDEDFVVLARKITLHQELPQYLHILELQVWGSGPYTEDDVY